jgi:hypothetical protein
MTTTNPSLTQWKICATFRSIWRRSSLGSVGGGEVGAEVQGKEPAMVSFHPHSLKRCRLPRSPGLAGGSETGTVPRARGAAISLDRT